MKVSMLVTVAVSKPGETEEDVANCIRELTPNGPGVTYFEVTSDSLFVVGEE